jgi:nucleoid-associated protein EbfC
MKNLGQMMKQAQQMQAKMAELQQSLDGAEIVGASGGGMVSATLNGKGELRKLKIDPTLVDPENVEMLEDLVVAACTDAKTKVDAYSAEEMSKLTGGLELPEGFKLPF